MSVTCVIIDDEKPARDTLSLMIKNFCPELNVIGEAETVNDAYQLLESESPLVIFLDVKMNDQTGFDLLRKINANNYYIVFVTAYNQYAIDAIKSDANDYILKPINPDELSEVVNRFLKSNFYSERKKKNNHKSLLLPSKNKFIAVNTKEIIRVEADNNYSNIFLKDGSIILVSKNLKSFEELINSTYFIRVHSKHLVNKENIKSITKGQDASLELLDGTIIPVSRERKSGLLKSFG